MTKKTGYEELELRIKELEQDALGCMRVEKALKPNAVKIDSSNIELESPHLVDGKYSIKDLIDIESLNQTIEKFSLATGFPAGLLEYPSQEILILTGWRDICKKFHRAFPESARHCKDSNIYLTKQLKEPQELNIKLCKNGLVDGATPIVIKGKYIANIVIGQILFKVPDIEQFKRQAQMYGYDLEAYLEALSKVPVVSEDQFKNALSFLSELAVMIAETGLNSLRLKEKTRELGEEITRHKLTEKTLREREEHFRKLAEGSFEAIVLHEKNVIFDANNQYYELFGYNPDELAGKDAISLTATPESVVKIKKQISNGNFGPYEVTGVKKDGTKFPMEIRIKLVSYNGHKVRMAVIRDLTEQKRMEEALKKRTRELEIKTDSLAEINTAMKVLLNKRENDKTEIEDNVLTNVKELIAPFFKKIKKTKLDDQQKTFLGIIESNLNEIISPFTRKMSLNYLNLTPTEIRIANLIRHGSPSKEIAELLNISPRTVETHRKNIRRKIGLEGKRKNLRSHLLSLH